MAKKILESNSTLPYSKAVIHNDKFTMEIAGQIGLNSSGKLEEGIELQTKQTMENIKKILNEVGWDFKNVIKVRIYLRNMSDYKTVNDIYAKYFSGNYPSRVALAVKELPLDALIETECCASGEKIKH